MQSLVFVLEQALFEKEQLWKGSDVVLAAKLGKLGGAADDDVDLRKERCNGDEGLQQVRREGVVRQEKAKEKEIVHNLVAVIGRLRLARAIVETATAVFEERSL